MFFKSKKIIKNKINELYNKLMNGTFNDIVLQFNYHDNVFKVIKDVETYFIEYDYDKNKITFTTSNGYYTVYYYEKDHKLYNKLATILEYIILNKDFQNILRKNETIDFSGIDILDNLIELTKQKILLWNYDQIKKYYYTLFKATQFELSNYPKLCIRRNLNKFFNIVGYNDNISDIKLYLQNELLNKLIDLIKDQLEENGKLLKDEVLKQLNEEIN